MRPLGLRVFSFFVKKKSFFDLICCTISCNIFFLIFFQSRLGGNSFLEAFFSLIFDFFEFFSSFFPFFLLAFLFFSPRCHSGMSSVTRPFRSVATPINQVFEFVKLILRPQEVAINHSTDKFQQFLFDDVSQIQLIDRVADFPVVRQFRVPPQCKLCSRPSKFFRCRSWGWFLTCPLLCIDRCVADVLLIMQRQVPAV